MTARRIIQPMRPITASVNLRERLEAVLHNIAQFDAEAFARWHTSQHPTIVATSEARRPNALYQLKRKVEDAHAGLFVVIVGYLRDGRCAVQNVEDVPTFRPALHVHPDDLEDVTDIALTQLK